MTTLCFTIVLPKKDMDARCWPHLHKAGGLLPCVRTDFRQWAWEGDQNDNIINATADRLALGMISGEHFGQVIILGISVKCDFC